MEKKTFVNIAKGTKWSNVKLTRKRDLFSGVAHVEIDVVAVVRNQLVARSENGEAQEHEGSDELG